MSGILVFRIPPAVLGHHHPGVYSLVELGPFLDFPPGGFDPNPVPLSDTVLRGGLGMDLHNGVRPDLSEPGNLAVGRVEKGGGPQPGVEDIGEIVL